MPARILLQEPPTSPETWPDTREPAARPVLHLPRSGCGVPYYLHVPRRIDPTARPLIAVHGISRRAGAHLEAFAPWAERTGRILIAPLFAEKQCRRYQRMLVDRRRADHALFAVLKDVEATTGRTIDRFDFFGFSGGAQFGHRLALMYPDHIGRLALASAGWYTFPDQAVAFPYGLSPGEGWAGAFRARLPDCLSIPILVLVGERDVLRDSALRKRTWVDERQGRTRVERAARWTMAMRDAARWRGIEPTIDFQTLPRSGHSFEACVDDGGLVELVTGWMANCCPTGGRSRH
ncbi:MAG: alpha/beta hydrolase [Pseudomonadota bacterium]